MKHLSKVLCMLLAITFFLLTACGEAKEVIDYADAEAFEAALNNGENLEGKIVQFEAKELHPNSSLGYNIWAGEHLNFVSSRNPNVKEGDTIVVKATTIESTLGSWVIHYEKIDNAMIGDNTIFSEPSSPNDNIDSSDLNGSDDLIPSPTPTPDPTPSPAPTPTPSPITFSFAGIDFMIPSYYENSDKNKDDEYQFVATTDDIVSIMFNSLPLTSKEYSLGKDSLEETLRNQDDWELLSEDNITFLDSTVRDFSYSQETGSGIKAYMHLSFVHNPNTEKVVLTMLVYAGNPEYNYLNDYYKMLETATLIDNPPQNSSPSKKPTTGEKNALQSAKQYLTIMAFSYSGLIEQLEFEGYSTSEATYAADNCGADWNEQAAKSAKEYLSIMSFSRSGLIEQLEYEGFTHEQAVYGAEANGY